MPVQEHIQTAIRTSAGSRQNHRYAWYVLFVLFLVSTFNYADRYIFSIVLEPLKAEFHLSDTALGLLGGVAFAVLYAGLGIPVARWADVGNRRNIISLAVAIWTLMTIACGLANNFIQLIIARVAVGIGEAGATPPSHSLIGDYFPVNERGRAIAIFTLGASAGYVLAFILGGWITVEFGWRAAFVAMGLPGLIVALLVRFSVKDPRQATAFVRPPERPDLLHAAVGFWSNRSYRHLCIGYSLSAFVGYGGVQWFPAFMARSHGVTLKEIGMTYGLVILVSGVIGVIAGGILSDRLVRRNVRWLALYPAVITLVNLPISLCAVLTRSYTTLLGLLFVSSVFGNLILPGVLAALHAVIKPGERALGIAVCFLFVNLIGMGLGPIAVGAISDLLNPSFGREALRYALAISYVLGLWIAFHWYVASRTMAADAVR